MAENDRFNDAKQREKKNGNTTDINVSCYENEIPHFVEAEMVRLYENLYSSVFYFKICGETDRVSTYVVSEEGKITTIFLFRREGKTVHVLNQLIKIDQQQINRFAEFIFSKFGRGISLISLRAVEVTPKELNYPFQHVNWTENIVLTLPRTAEEYLSMLGKSTRKYIKYHINRPKRDFPSFRYDVYIKDEVTEQQIREVIRLNKARMDEKNKIAGIDEKEAQQIIQLVNASGITVIATIDDKICAGVICWRVGENIFMRVIAHDPFYNDYRLGMLACYFTICECIEKGGKTFHFLWGREDYKFRLLGVEQKLDLLNIYRSRLHWLMNINMIIKTELTNKKRQAKLWLLSSERRESFVARWAVHTVRWLRTFMLRLTSRTV